MFMVQFKERPKQVDTVRLSAHAKVNLYLDVLGKRVDGYHNIQSIIQNLELSDELLLTDREDSEIEVISEDLSSLPKEKNLVWQAATLLQNEAADQGATIQLKKFIPLAAGLGGGSANAAAVIIGLHKLWKLDLPIDFLLLLGSKIGADVPACMVGGTILAEGKGEKVAQLSAMPFTYVVVARPDLRVSTKIVYGQFDLVKIPPLGGAMRMLAAVKKHDIGDIGRNMANLLEEVTLANYPEIARLRQAAIKTESSGVLMTGSGPCVFALAASKEQASVIASDISDYAEEVFITSTYPKGVDTF